MNSSKLIKILGLVAAVGSIGLTLFTGWVNDKMLDEKINERIAAKLAALGDD